MPGGPEDQGQDREMTAPQIEWIHLDAPEALGVGDVVSAAAGGLPIYRVVALADQGVWVRDEDHAATWLAPIHSLHWKAAPGMTPVASRRLPA
jgi:hypothetical protein